MAREKVASNKSAKAKAADLLAQISNQPSPVDEETRKTRLKTLIKLGKDRGFLTYAEVNDHLPDDVVDAEQIESIISTFSDMGIQVYDEAPDAETLLMSDNAPTVGADIVELHPGRDLGDVTAIVGAKLVRELAALIDRNGPYKN